MAPSLITAFLDRWSTYFGKAELPIIFYYSESTDGAVMAPRPRGRSCLVCELGKVRKGKSLYFNAGNISCGGALRYLGYTDRVRPGFEYFLSCGKPGEVEGERYIRTPEMVKVLMKNQRHWVAGKNNIIFKRWDKLSGSDDPQVVIFFASPDVLSGLFTLANYDQTDPCGSFAPFGSGCGTIIHYPYLETMAERPRAVIGMFDPSARPCVPQGTLSYAIPMKRFEKMIGYMDECFLITDTWKEVHKRINSTRSAPGHE